MNHSLSWAQVWRLLDLRSDQADSELIDTSIRGNAGLAGTNLWVLMLAIAIASIGLNVNSTAVIIGAMLISPLMGPIIGIGYGASIHDYALIRQCFRILGLFVGISLLASTSYFLLTPLTQAHSELLARTSPSLWDVLIAFFGGAAGMIGLTRKEKTTLIPGVAIATALMPPLCTAGYGIASAQVEIFFGAFYLFLINSVFITLATLAIGRILRLPRLASPSRAARRRGQWLIAAAITVTLVPSIYLTYLLVRQEIFVASAEQFVRVNLVDREDVALISHRIDAAQRVLKIVIADQDVTPDLEEQLGEKLKSAGLTDTRLVIRHLFDNQVDTVQLRRELRQDVAYAARLAVEKNAARQVAELAQLEKEIKAQLPNLRDVIVSGKTESDVDGKPRRIVLVMLDSARGLAASERERLKRWLKARHPEAEPRIVLGRTA